MSYHRRERAAGKFQRALALPMEINPEAVAQCHKLLEQYPDDVDGLDRLATVYEAKGQNRMAAEYYRKAAAFMRSRPGFDNEAIEWALNKASQLESGSSPSE